MNKLEYTSPEMEIRWFESVELISASITIEDLFGNGIVDDDEW